MEGLNTVAFYIFFLFYYYYIACGLVFFPAMGMVWRWRYELRIWGMMGSSYSTSTIYRLAYYGRFLFLDRDVRIVTRSA